MDVSDGFYRPLWASGSLAPKQAVLSSEFPVLNPHPEPSLTTPKPVSPTKKRQAPQEQGPISLIFTVPGPVEGVTPNKCLLSEGLQI